MTTLATRRLDLGSLNGDGAARAIELRHQLHLDQRCRAHVRAALACDRSCLEAPTARAVVGQERKVTA